MKGSSRVPGRRISERPSATLLSLVLASAGILAAVLPWIGDGDADLEIHLGLNLLYGLRGVRESPPEVAVVLIDRKTMRDLRLPDALAKWSRGHHAQLLDRLRGARTVIFDLRFTETRDRPGDLAFARAIEKAGNVILLQHRYPTACQEIVDPRGSVALCQQEISKKPLPLFAEPAAMLAPFLVPGWTRADQVWLWDPGVEETLPTIPLAALLAYSSPHLRLLVEALSTAQPASPGVAALVDLLRTEHLPRLAMGLRRLLMNHPSLVRAVTEAIANGPNLDAGARRALLALIRSMSGSDTIQLNHYGPPGTLKTYSYQCVVAGACADPAGDVATGLRGRAVFVGYSSARTGEVHDEFQTLYGRSSGVEISATAFANLIEQNHLRVFPMYVHVLFIAVWSALLAQIVTPVSTRAALLVLAGTVTTYVALNYVAFVRLHLWLPLAVPVFIQAPLAAGARLWRDYRDERAERARIQIELSRIEDGLRVYLPKQVVTRIATNTEEVLSQGQIMYGVCIHSDAGQFTKLSETMRAVSLRALLNAYYEPLFDAVNRHDGWVSDVVGDAMLAVWPTTGPDPEARRAACLAALDMLRATRAPDRVCLPTRIGVHCGELVLGNVGARGRFEYRAVGEVVNKTERIERTNKRLGTALLVSGEVLRGLDTLITRELGCFYLPGTTRAIDLYEVIDPETGDLAVAQKKWLRFGAGLAAFRLRDYAGAQRIFTRVIDEFGQDGPAHFYLELCARFVSLPPQASWEGCVRL